MGYTHYYSRPRELNAYIFRLVMADTRRIVTTLAAQGVLLAGPDGSGEPLLNANTIALNGQADCGHPDNTKIVIPWPSEDAGGVAEPGQEAVSGEWFAGVQLSSRTCNGSCDYESFIIERVLEPLPWQRPDQAGRYFTCCKTAFRPYDLAVIALLICFKQRFGDVVTVSSDGTDAQWLDGKLLCSKLFGFGFEFGVNEQGELVRLPGPSQVPTPDGNRR